MSSKTEQSKQHRYSLSNVRDFARRNAQMTWYLARSRNYQQAYRKFVNWQVRRDGAMEAVGGDNLGIGQLQFDFLKQKGLLPDDRLLDLGCGTLRFGRYVIPYLDDGMYTGVDISDEMIEAARATVETAGLAEKSPTIIQNADLTFSENLPKHDYIIANSVMTHLLGKDIKQCFEHIHRVLKDDGVFYTTFFDTKQRPLVAYAYKPEQMVAWAAEYGLDARVLPRAEYDHPRGQRMLEVKRITE